MAGQIIEKGKSKYLVRVYLGTDEKGKRKYHSKLIHGNKKTAQAYLNKKLLEKDTGTFVEPSRDLLGKYLTDWLETTVKARVKEATFRSYKQIVKLYIRPNLGDIKMVQLTPMKIQAFYNSMTEKGLSSRTVRYTHSVLKDALEQAVKWQLLQRNPAQHVDLPRHEKAEMRAMSPGEAKRFLDAAIYSRWSALFSLMVTTGVRPSEAPGLRWEDIDLKEGRISIQRTLTRGKDGWKLEEPKTAKSRRTIPLPETVQRDLKAHKAQQAKEKLQAEEYTDHGFVFATQTGEPLMIRNVIGQYFKPLLEHAGLPGTIRLYDLRHTCATLLLSAGENPKVVSERLGHASVTLTLDTYSHVLPGMQKSATDKLESMLFGTDEKGHAHQAHTKGV